MRRLFTALLFLPLAACSQTWDETRPATPPGGTGISTAGVVADETVASVAQLSVSNRHGAIEPYGTKGKTSAYEFGAGYRVGAGDRLAVKVAGEADLTSEYLVDGAGNISLPYVQTIAVSGMTTVQIEALIGRRLRQGYLRDPQVSVQVNALRPFYILGEVNTSGSFAYQPGMTVQNAIAIGGGYSSRADQRTALITRKNAKGTATYKVPVTTQVFPGDIIYVRERWF